MSRFTRAESPQPSDPRSATKSSLANRIVDLPSPRGAGLPEELRSPLPLRGVRSPGYIQPEQEPQSPGLVYSLWTWMGYIPPKDGVVHEACRQRDLNLLRALINQDPWQAGLVGQQYLTPLMISSATADTEAVKVLLAAPKCNPLARDENRRSALHHLCLGGHDKALLAKELAEHGGQKLLDAQDAFGCSALHYAAQKGLVNVLKVIVQYNGSVMLTDRDGLDALVYVSRCAAGKGEAVMEMRRVLVEAQSKVQEVEGLWACVTKLCRDDDDDTATDGTKRSTEHPVRALMLRANIPEAAIDRYIENLRRFGYDNITALKSIGSEKLLQRYVSDVVDRRRLLDVLENEWPELPPPHMPSHQFIKELLMVTDDVAIGYADALKKHSGLRTGTQLMSADYETQIDPALRYAPIGHKKAFRLVTQAQIIGTQGPPPA